MRCLHDQGIEGRLVVVRDRGRARAVALLERAGSRWFLWKGPAGGNPSSEVLQAILSRCADLASVTLVLQPEWAFGSPLHSAGFSEGAPFSTLLVPTAGADAQILARMAPATRGRVRRGMRAGLQFAEDATRLKGYYTIYEAAMDAAASPDFATLGELESVLGTPDVHLFVALMGDDIAAGSVCFEHQDSVEARYVATSASHRPLGPLNFLHFESIRWAAQRGRAYLDLSGWASETADAKTSNINRFKEGFGGARRDYPVFTRE